MEAHLSSLFTIDFGAVVAQAGKYFSKIAAVFIANLAGEIIKGAFLGFYDSF